MHECFERWVREHHAAVYRSAWRILRDADAARDVTQDVFVQALQREAELARAPTPERVLRWLAVKGALARLRGDRNRRRREEETAMLRPERLEVERPEERELAAAVASSVAELPDELRLATVLRFQEGLTFAQVGECLGVAEPTAFERVRKALERLRGRLAQLGHVGGLATLEQSLAAEESIEAIALPAGLAPKLLALSSSTAAATGAATSATPAVTTIGSKPLLVLAAALLVTLTGIFVVREARDRSAPVTVPVSAAAQTPRLDETAKLQEDRGRPAGEAAPATRAPVTRSGDAASVASAAPAAPIASAPETGTLAGIVVDADGRAVSGAAVEAISFEAASKGFQWHAEGTTSAAGAFALEVPVVVEGGQRYLLHVKHDDFVPHRTDRFVVKAGATTDAGKVAIRRNAADRAGDFVLAVVVEDRAGSPIPGAFVRLYREIAAYGAPASSAASGEERERELEAGPWEAGGVTDATGVVRLAGSRIGRKLLVIDAARMGHRVLREPLEIEWTGFVERRFTLGDGLAIAGRIVFPPGCDVAKESIGADVPVSELPKGGFPPYEAFADANALVHLPGASVYAIGRHPSDWRHGELAADGSFRIVGLDAGTYTVHVRSRFSPAALFDVEAGRIDLEIPLKRAHDERDVGVHLGEIHGRLVDAATSEPVLAGFDDVEVDRLEDGELDASRLQADVLPGLTSPRMRQVAVDVHFRPPPPAADFHLTGLDSGGYVVVARVKGFAVAFSDAFQLARGELVKDVTIALHRPASVTGVVRDERGRPIAKAVVFAAGVGPRSSALIQGMDESVRTHGGPGGIFLANTVFTDARGRFELGGLPPQLRCSIVAIHPKHTPATTPPLALSTGTTTDAGELRLPPRP